MKKVNLTLLALFFLFTTLILGCKQDIDENAYLLDPEFKKVATKFSLAEAELKSTEATFLDAQKKYLEARKNLSETSDTRDTYYTFFQRLDLARKNHTYYAYRFKYEKIAAQERYLRSLQKEKILKQQNSQTKNINF
jgi:hypothetical protein